MLRQDTSVFGHSRHQPTHKGIIARHTDAALEKISRKLTTGGSSSLVNGGTSEGVEEDDEGESGIIFDDEDEDIDSHTDANGDTQTQKGKSKKKGKSKTNTRNSPKANSSRRRGGGGDASFEEDGDSRTDPNANDVVAEMKADILTSFRKLEFLEEEALCWEGKVLSMIMVTSDAMTTASRILKHLNSNQNVRTESRQATASQDFRSEYSPSVVETLIDSCIKPMHKATTCAKDFRAEVNSMLEKTDGSGDTTDSHISALRRLFNEMSAVHIEMTLQLQTSVFYFVKQHRDIFNDYYDFNIEKKEVERNKPTASTRGPKEKNNNVAHEAVGDEEIVENKTLTRKPSRKLLDDIAKAASGLAVQQSSTEDIASSPSDPDAYDKDSIDKQDGKSEQEGKDEKEEEEDIDDEDFHSFSTYSAPLPPPPPPPPGAADAPSSSPYASPHKVPDSDAESINEELSMKLQLDTTDNIDTDHKTASHDNILADDNNDDNDDSGCEGKVRKGDKDMPMSSTEESPSDGIADDGSLIENEEESKKDGIHNASGSSPALGSSDDDDDDDDDDDNEDDDDDDDDDDSDEESSSGSESDE